MCMKLSSTLHSPLLVSASKHMHCKEHLLSYHVYIRIGICYRLPFSLSSVA